MMDSGIGLDFVSLSQPPLHAVPLFEVNSSDMEGFDEKRVKRALKLPRGAEINMIISVGLGTEDGIWGERYRVPYDEVVFKK
jgi:nitroreductase